MSFGQLRACWRHCATLHVGSHNFFVGVLEIGEITTVMTGYKVPTVGLCGFHRVLFACRCFRAFFVVGLRLSVFSSRSHHAPAILRFNSLE